MSHFRFKIFLLILLIPHLVMAQSLTGDRVNVDTLSAKIPSGLDTMQLVSNADFSKAARFRTVVLLDTVATDTSRYVLMWDNASGKIIKCDTAFFRSLDMESFQKLPDTSFWDATRFWTLGQISDSIAGFLISEVDGSLTNEGWLDVVQAGVNSSAITSNTQGSPQIYIKGGANVTVTESADTIILASAGGENYWTWINSTTDTVYNNKTGVLFLATDLITDNTLRTEGNTVLGRNAGGSFTHSSALQGWYNTLLGNNAGSVISSGYENTAIGYNALDAATTGYQNVAIGNNVMTAGSGVYRNVGIGYNALSGASYSSNNNVAIGYAAMDAATTSDNSVAIGSNALGANQSADYCIAIGTNALSTLTLSTNDSYNIAIGYNAGASLDYQNNVLIGHEAGRYLGQCQENVALGKNALFGNTSGVYNSSMNVAVGNNAGYSISGGAMGNTILGTAAGSYLTTGDNNVVIGNYTGSGAGSLGLTTQNSQLWIDASSTATPLIKGDFYMDTVRINGALSIRDVTVSIEKYFLVLDSATNRICKMDTTGWRGSTGGTGVNYWTLDNDTLENNTGIVLHFNDDVFSDRWLHQQNNTAYGIGAFGDSALAHSSGIEGYYNTAVGNNSLYLLTTGAQNSALGYLTLYSNTTGIGNAALGYRTLYSNSAGNYNTGFGNNALYANTTGNNNVALGTGALRLLTEGDGNVAIGKMAGYSVSTGDYNVFIGNDAGWNETGSNQLYIENSSSSQPLIKGDFSADSLRINGSLSIRDVTASIEKYFLVMDSATHRIYAMDTAGWGGSGGGVTGDNLGNHNATEDLILKNYDIKNVDSLYASNIYSVSGDYESAIEAVSSSSRPTAILKKTATYGYGVLNPLQLQAYGTSSTGDGIGASIEFLAKDDAQNYVLMGDYQVLMPENGNENETSKMVWQTMKAGGSLTEEMILTSDSLTVNGGLRVTGSTLRFAGIPSAEYPTVLMYNPATKLVSYYDTTGLGGSGAGGDMFKSTYDTDSDAIVDNSEKVNNSLSNGFGVTALSFNGSSAKAITIDTTALKTVFDSGGDMFKATYDTDNDNTVDNAEKVSGALTNGYGVMTLTYDGSSTRSIVIDTTTLKNVFDGGSGGDMYKSTYDTDNDGVVDNSEKVQNILSNGYGVMTLSYDGSSAKAIVIDTAALKNVFGGTGGGDVYKVGTPVNNQVGVWTGDGTLEGDGDLLFDGTKLTTGKLNISTAAAGSSDYDKFLVLDVSGSEVKTRTGSQVLSDIGAEAALTKGTLTENVTGLQFDNTRQVIGGATTLSLTSGYVIPTTTQESNWNQAYSWGNHALAGYLIAETDPQVGIITTNYLSKWDGSSLVSSNILDHPSYVRIEDSLKVTKLRANETSRLVMWNASTGEFSYVDTAAYRDGGGGSIQEIDPIWISDSTDYMHHSDTTTRVASRKWVQDQGYLTELETENDPIWISDSTDYLHHSDTTTRVASRKWVLDQGYLTELGAETDPIWISDSTDYLHHSDTTTKVASRKWVQDQGYLTELGAETDPVWISDSTDYLHHSDTTSKVASRKWVQDQGYLTELGAEIDPVWISDSTDYLHHSDTTSKVASRKWVLDQGFLLEPPQEKDPVWVNDSSDYLHHSDTLTKVASRKWVADQAYINKEEDPQVGSSNTTNYLSKWDGSALNASEVYDDGSYVRIPDALKIGAGAPSTQLDVDGSAAIDGTLSVNNIKLTNASAGTSLVALVLDGGQNVDLNTLSDDLAAIEDSSKWSKSGSYVFQKTLTDYVGIGTNAPSGLFHVYGNMYIGKTAGNPIKPRIINNEVPTTWIEFGPGEVSISPSCYIHGDLIVTNDFTTDEINTDVIVENTSGDGVIVKDWGGSSIASFTSMGTVFNRPTRVPIQVLSNQTSVVTPYWGTSVYVIDADANIDVWCNNAIIGAGQLLTIISDNADDQSYTITLKDYGAGSVITTIPIDPSFDTKAVTLLYTGSKWVVYSTGND